MKKLFIILSASILIASCNKKASPAASNTNTSGSNTSGVVSTATPSTTVAEAKSVPADVATTSAESAASQGAKSRDNKELSVEQQGQATYNAKCGRCHGLKVTTDYTADRWATVMQVMAGPSYAKLSDVEKENVLAYVKANAKK